MYRPIYSFTVAFNNEFHNLILEIFSAIFFIILTEEHIPGDKETTWEIESDNFRTFFSMRFCF